MNTRQERIEIVNAIIKEIASRDHKFFAHDLNIAYIFEKGGKLYMKNEYNGENMCIYPSHPNGYQPNRWHNAWTLWALTKDFRDFIVTGEKTNGQNRYGGLFCEHWGYPESDMEAIREKAKSLGYL